MLTRTCTVLSLGVLCCVLQSHRVGADEPAAAPRQVMQDAVAVWHFGDVNDSAGANSPVVIQRDVTLSTPLEGTERAASLARGGDGLSARLTGGYLDAGQGANNELNLTGDQLTALLRVKIAQKELWSTRGFFTKGGGHDKLVFNFFSYDFNQGQELMRLGCEIGVDGRAGLAGHVAVHLDRIGFEGWHDVVARYDGKALTLFVDGVNLDSQPVQGPLRTGNTEPLAIGGGTYQGQCDDPFPGLIDHAAIWKRALSDEEIVILCGGAEHVAERQAVYAGYVPPPPRQPTWELVQRSRELKEKFQGDHHRPRYHFLIPEEGDIMPGDPNGAIWWKGRYHLFYIFQRFQTIEPTVVHCWGHASSPDLVHWEHHPTALDVAPGDPDRGIFSGNAYVSKTGVPTILYHGVGIGNSIAEAQDDLLTTWKKSPANPIVPIPKPGSPGHGQYESWDPHGWLEGDDYFAIFGGAKPGLFKGPEITQLKYKGPFLTNDRWSEPIEDVSCPDFFPIGDKHMLLCISHCRGARYFLGTWKDEKFTAQSHGRMNWPGGGFFAPETLLAPQGRRILWAWCMDERPAPVRVDSGWSGVMSLPRSLSLAEGELHIEPAIELEQLRFNPRELTDVVVTPGAEVSLSDAAHQSIHGDSIELEVTIDPLSAKQVGIKVRQTPDSQEETSILVDCETQTLRVDINRSTLDPRIQYRTWCITRPTDPDDANRRVTGQVAPLSWKHGEPVILRIYLDRSMLEVFANNQQCLTQRLWPTRQDAQEVSVFSVGGPARFSQVRAWDMAATIPE